MCFTRYTAHTGEYTLQTSLLEINGKVLNHKNSKQSKLMSWITEIIVITTLIIMMMMMVWTLRPPVYSQYCPDDVTSWQYLALLLISHHNSLISQSVTVARLTARALTLLSGLTAADCIHFQRDNSQFGRFVVVVLVRWVCMCVCVEGEPAERRSQPGSLLVFPGWKSEQLGALSSGSHG